MQLITKRLIWSGVSLGATTVIAAGWLGFTAWHAGTELTAARTALPVVRAAVLQGQGAAPALAALQAHARAADDDTHDPVWSIAAALPWIGTPAATTQGLTRAVRDIATVSLPAVAAASDSVHPTKLLAGGGRVDVQALSNAVAPLSAAATSLRVERGHVAALSPSWVGPLAKARSELLDQLTPLADTAQAAADAARVLPPLLGRSGARRYFVGFQNPAEARGTGGLLDAYAVVVADHGRITIERTGSNVQLPQLKNAVTGLSTDFVNRYAAQGGTDMWLNANLSPDFPEVALAWEAMWKAGTGQNLDGALALDPHTLAAILRATGPVQAPGVGLVDGARIEPLVLLDQYRIDALGAHRKDLMLRIGTAALDRLLAGKASPETLYSGLTEAARTGHVMIHTRTSSEQAVLQTWGLTGAVDPTPAPFAQAVLVNAGGNKLDTWLSQTLSYRVLQCSGSQRVVEVKVGVRNDAPTSGLPQYVTVRSDQPPFAVQTGQNRIEVQVLVTRGASLQGAWLDGGVLAPAPAADALPATLPDDAASSFLQAGQAAGRPAYGLDIEIKPGQTRLLTLKLVEPASRLRPLLPVQNLVRRPTVTADLSACGDTAQSSP